MHVRESVYFEWKQGIIPAERWSASKEIIKHNLAGEWNRRWWINMGQLTKSVEFASAVNELIKNEPFIVRCQQVKAHKIKFSHCL